MSRLAGLVGLLLLLAVIGCGSVPTAEADGRRADVEFSVLGTATPASQQELALEVWRTRMVERLVLVEDNGVSRSYAVFLRDPSNVLTMRHVHRILEAQPHVTGVFSIADYIGT